MQKKATFHELLERLNPIMGAILAFSLALKSSFLWTFGLLDYTKLPKPVPDILNAASGIGISLALETLSISAGAKAWNSFKHTKDIEFATQFSKKQRLAMIAKAQADVMVHGIFGGFGIAASTFAMVYFASGHISSGSGIGDVVIALAIQMAVIYIGVFFEPTQANPLTELLQSGYKAIKKIGDQYSTDIAEGNYDNKKVRALQAIMPPDVRHTFEPLIVSDGKVALWDSTQIVKFLLARFSVAEADLLFDTTQRNVRNRLNANQKDATFGIIPKPKGSGLLIPADMMFILFQEEIERAMSGGRPFTLARKRATRKAPLQDQGNGMGAETEGTSDSTATPEATLGDVVLAG